MLCTWLEMDGGTSVLDGYGVLLTKAHWIECTVTNRPVGEVVENHIPF
jgi:hypothetical protein